MDARPCLLLLLAASCFHLADFKIAEPGCRIELECAECIPDNMPLVTSHAAAGGAVAAAHGDEVTLACPGGAFLRYPLRGTVSAVCEAGRYRVRHDAALRHLLDLGCQESVFEDVLHDVAACGGRLQGRAYLVQDRGGARHLAAVCFDPDLAVAARAVATAAPANRLPLPPHTDARAPLSLLGNFNHMFDARTRQDARDLYADDERLTRRLRELLRHDRVTLADQHLTSAALLSPHYFEDQNSRVADFPSNLVAVWGSVRAGNLHHLQRDVARALKKSRSAGAGALMVHAGTHGVASARTGGGRSRLFLRGERFPVPAYVWTVVVDAAARRALAVALLNDPLVAVSEIRESVFCESRCGEARWLRDLRTNRNYEVPLYGLVFCCDVHNFTDVVPEMPKELIKDIPPGIDGMLLSLPEQ